VASFVDVYDFVESRLSGEQEQHHDAGNLQQIIAAEIDNYYMDMERALQAPDVDQVARCAASSSINPRTGGTGNLQSHHPHRL